MEEIKEYINEKLHNSAVLKEVIWTISEHFQGEIEALESKIRELEKQLKNK